MRKDKKTREFEMKVEWYGKGFREGYERGILESQTALQTLVFPEKDEL